MASVSTDGNGLRRVLFFGADGKRRAIRLGRVPIKAAQETCRRVEALNAARITDTAVDNDTAKWVGTVSVDMARKLARAGLVGPREARGAGGPSTLGPFLRAYIDARTDVRPNTRRNLEECRRYLEAYFGPTRPLADITPARAAAFGFHMRGQYAEATAARAVKRARQYFTYAVQDGLLPSDPFAKVKAGSMTNEERLYFVDRPTTEKLLEAAPDGEWRLIIALSRFGGLRTPSEHLALTWDDVDLAEGRFLVRAPKTGQRMVPVFPELRPHLEEAFDRAEPGAKNVIVRRTRGEGANWRTAFEKIIHRAGLVPWERLFQNLRASRETELAAEFPLHVVTAWIGNSAPVAAKHYLKVRDEDFRRAASPEAAQKAAHYPAQSVTVTD